MRIVMERADFMTVYTESIAAGFIVWFLVIIYGGSR